MRIEKINQQQPSMKKGLYFTQGESLFNVELYHYRPSIIKTSEEGFKYIEDLKISEEVKKRFANIPFIKELAEKFDTFISYTDVNNISVENATSKLFEKVDIFWVKRDESAKQATIETLVEQRPLLLEERKTLLDLLEKDKGLNKKLKKLLKSHRYFSLNYRF